MGAVWSSVDNILVLVSTYLQVLTQKWWRCHHAARSMIAACAHLKKKSFIWSLNLFIPEVIFEVCSVDSAGLKRLYLCLLSLVAMSPSDQWRFMDSTSFSHSRRYFLDFSPHGSGISCQNLRTFSAIVGMLKETFKFNRSFLLRKEHSGPLTCLSE